MPGVHVDPRCILIRVNKLIEGIDIVGQDNLRRLVSVVWVTGG